MTSQSRMAHVALVICGVLGACFGCSSTDPHYGVADSALGSLPPETGVGHEEVEALQGRLPQLRAVSREALDAAAAIGTTDHALSAAQQAWSSAEQSWQEGQQAYAAGQYQVSWQKFQTAESAFKHAEERAVRAGLSHIERELAQEYAHMLASEAQRAGVRRASAQVVEGVVNLRDGAGLNSQIIGQARAGQILQILAEVGEWYRVRTEQGRVGWVSKTLVVRVH